MEQQNEPTTSTAQYVVKWDTYVDGFRDPVFAGQKRKAFHNVADAVKFWNSLSHEQQPILVRSTLKVVEDILLDRRDI